MSCGYQLVRGRRNSRERASHWLIPTVHLYPAFLLVDAVDDGVQRGHGVQCELSGIADTDARCGPRDGLALRGA